MYKLTKITFIFILLGIFHSADAQVDGLDFSIGADTNVGVICSGTPVCLTFNATHTPLKSTEAYVLQNLNWNDYDQQTYTGANILTTDDVYSTQQTSPFSFCFYGGMFTNYVVGSNGILTFSTTNANNYLPYVPQTINNNLFPNYSMLFPFHDVDPEDLNSVGIWSKVVGVAPNRKLVISFDNVLWGQSAFPPACVGEPTQQHQLILHESTNFIDMVIKRKSVCSIISFPWLDKATEGIKKNGTTHMVVPGRDNSVWTTTNEVKRFVPNGFVFYPTTTDWFDINGNMLLSNSSTYTGCFSSFPTKIVGRITYTTCNGTPLVLRDTIEITGAYSDLDPVNIDAISDVGCTPGNGGSITASASGGVAPYSYSIGGGVWQNTGVFNNLSAGTYTVFITDAVGCQSDTTVTINTLPGIGISATAVTNADCNGAATGSVTIAGIGGTTPYTFAQGAGAFQNSGVFAGLAAGTYTFRVKDANDCEKDTTITITEPAAVEIASLTISDLDCHGDADAAVTIAGLGGNAPYTYAMGTGAYQASGTFTNLAAGTYTFHIKDNNGCEKDTTFTISQPVALTLGSVSVIDADCNGASTGEVSFTGSGGTAPYTYALGTGAYQGSGTFTGLAAGTYTIHIQDANNCHYSTSITIGEPTAVMISGASIVLATCNQSNGSVTLTGSGGTAPYTYAQGTGTYQASGTFTGLAAGTYTFHIQDANGCTHDTIVNVSQPSAVGIGSATVTDVDCHGASTGEVTLTGTGGTAPYTYAQGTGAYQASGTFTGLAAGTYTFHIKDDNGCIIDTTITINEPTPIDIAGSLSITDIDCNGNADGEVTIGASGGTSPYTYALGTGAYQASGTFSNLAAGTHTFHVLDANGCQKDTTITITEPDPLVIGASSVIDADCHGASTGEVTLTGTGGTAPYMYAQGAGAYQASGTFTGLAAGTYTFHIQDAMGCESDTTITISEPTPVMVSGVTIQLATCNQSNGSVTLTGSGGTAPYTYAQGTNPYQASGTFTGLAAGSYTFHIKDANGCIKDTVVSVSQPSAVGIASTTVTDVDCHGASTGEVTLTGTGGTTPYTYAQGTGAYQASGTFTGLTAGTYTFHVKDDNGCIIDTTITINEPTPIDIAGSLNVTNIDCNGNADGEVVFMASGGTSPYTYAMGTGAYQASGAFSNLAVGTYTFHVLDANGCQKDTTITITEPDPLVIGASSVIDADCHGASTGEVTLTGTGGTAPYMYAQGTGAYQASGTFTGLAAGTYTFHIQDAMGCESDTTITIVEPTEVLVASINIQIATCNQNNGEVTITAMGGTAPYTYAVGTNPYQTSGTFTGLGTATYTFHIQDANGCTKDTTVSVSGATVINIDSMSIDTPTCYASANGAITVHASNGATPYTYAILPGVGQPTNVFTNLTAGTYTIEVTDADACTDTMSIVISQPDSITTNAIITNVDCNGNNTGEVIFAASGGTAPFTYAEGTNPFQASGTFTGLVAGTYTFHILDDNGCQKDTIIEITQPDPVEIGMITVTDPDCHGTSTGVINVTGAGGTAPFTYAIGTGAFQSSGIFTGLAAGTYVIHLLDANSCALDTSITLVDPPILVFDSLMITDVLCYGDSTGEIVAYTSGGVAPYTYSINAGTYGTNSTFAGLQSGTYTISVQDSRGCTMDTTITLNQGLPILVSTATIDPMCAGDLTGQLNITVTNGAAPYTYSYNGNLSTTGSNITGLGADIYYVLVTDAQGCHGMDTATLVDPPAIIVDFTTQDVSCFGLSDGSVVGNPINGTAPYTYSLDGGAFQLSGSFSGLLAGTHTLKVADANGCSSDTVFTITQPDDIMINANVTGVQCHGSYDGVLEITSAIGGTLPFTYSLDGALPVTQTTFVNLAAGTHTIEVIDDNGCTKTFTYFINEPDLLNLSIQITPPTCDILGTLTVSGTGGTAPYIYVLDGVAYSTPTIGNLDTGMHVIRIVDSRNCYRDTSFYIEPNALPNIMEVNAKSPSCYGDENGTVSVVVENTNPPYLYALDPITGYQASPNFQNLKEGSYTVMVKDKDGCESMEPVSLIEPDSLMMTLDVVSNNCATPEDDGSILPVLTGGTTPYSYQWSHMTQDTSMAIGLAEGVYTITVLDSNGCRVEGAAEIVQDNCCKPYVPTAFTPNNDGLNDYFEIYNLDAMNYLRAEIYNRYGQVIYTGFNELRWDGKFNGKEVELGVYHIRIRYSCRGWGDETFDYIGEVHLIK